MSDTVSRDAIRAAIFDAKPDSKTITMFGVQVEVRQPPLSEILDVQEETDRKSSIFRSMMRYVFVPGTSERVFEDADRESFLNLPFGKDMQGLQDAIGELTNIEAITQEEVKN